MELVDERLHRTLTYVAAVQRYGAVVTRELVQTFAVQPFPAPRRTSFLDLASVVASYNRAFERETQAAEGPVAFLLRVGWIEDGASGVRLTDLGRAVLAHADRPVVADAADGPLTVTIDPEDPLAYARLFDLLSSHGDGLLVDRYLKLDGLADLIDISAVNRVLTSDEDSRNRLSLFRRAVEASASSIELRVAPAAELHDRFFIPDDGPIYVLGSSLNSIAARPGVVTPIVDTAASTAVRAAYSGLWSRSRQLPASTTPELEA